MNELPDLAPKIQVSLFNIMQEGDVQIKGFPVRLPLDVLLVFSANPEDYTARGKIVTPLKDRIGSEIKTHYPHRLDEGIRITSQESWIDRGLNKELVIPDFIQEIVEGVAFYGRRDSRIDKRSGISQRVPISCLENSVSNAERRAVLAREKKVVLRVADVYASIPAITGKLELEYEGQLRGEENIARELIETSVLNAFVRRFPNGNFDRIVQWFDLGGEIKVTDQTPAREYLKKVKPIQGLEENVRRLGVTIKGNLEWAVSVIELILEGLYAQKKLSRSEERGYHKAAEKVAERYFEDFAEPKKSFN